MDSMNFNFSAKNIPIANRRTYFEMMIRAVEKFGRNSSWRALFKLNPDIVSRVKETFGFRSTRAAPRIPELKDFEQDLIKMVQSIKFRKRSNPFLENLKKENSKIASQNKLIIPADKTSNNYLVPPKEYKDLMQKEIQKNYRKVNEKTTEEVRKAHTETAKELELEDRMFRTTPRNSFITLKDHKNDFNLRPGVRLINPTKNEMGQPAMQILDGIVKEIRRKTQLQQCTNTREVINWFTNLKNKKGLKFIVYDIDSFYPSITQEVMDDALEWASTYLEITPLEKKIIHQACQSFLYNEGTPWVKRGRENFDIGMGAFHGAQACELVGLFMLDKLQALQNFETIIYRDDGLAVTSSTPRQQEKLKQEIIRIFGEQGMKITIEINLRRVDYLDVTLDLDTELYKPYRKPGDKPLYVSAESNHPPLTLKNIPKGIERRLSDNSANREVFEEAIPAYQTELNRCGYDHVLEYRPGNYQQGSKKSKTRKRRITWFNPPYSLDVETNVGKEFLNLVDKHFPPGHILHSVMNRTTVKVSYRGLPNMRAQISRHNTKILREAGKGNVRPQPKCNCQITQRAACPIPGACNQRGVVYQARVATGGVTKTYVGLAANFKKRFYKHKATLQVKPVTGSTTLSTHFWTKKDEGEDPTVSWKILETGLPTFDPVSRACKLCLREKFNIVLKPELATLNSRNEIFAHCRHMGSKLIGQPPD